MKLKTKPYPHQLKAMKRALRQGSHAFFFEPRLGKTKAALDTVSVQHVRGNVQKVVVIAPLIALDVWVQQIQQHLSVPARIKVIGEKPFEYLPYVVASDHKWLKFYLVNYDKFSRRGEDEAYRNDHLASVERWSPDCIILDESQRVKSAGAVRSQALWRMVRRLRTGPGHRHGYPHVYLLTGTPSPKGYLDLFSQFRILDDSVFGTSKASFENHFCIYGLGSRKYTVVGYRNKDVLLEKVRNYSSVVTAKKAGLAGVQHFNPIRIKLPPQVRRKYEQVAEDFVAEIQGELVEAANPGVRRLRLLQITGGFSTSGRCYHQAKVRALSDYTTDLFQQQEHVVVYARFLAEVDVVAECLTKVGYHTWVITGSTPRKDRTKAIRAFGYGAPSALVFQVETGSLAIDLSRAAEVVFYSLPDSWGTFYQCLERVLGPNQKRPVRYTLLLASGTVDQSVLETLRAKRDIHAELMKHPREFLYGL